MKILITIFLLCYSSQVSFSQELYDIPQSGLEDCYCTDYKTDFGPGEELARPKRCFFKKLFKKWGRWNKDDCVECCQNNAGYSGGSAGNGDSYSNSYNYNNPPPQPPYMGDKKPVVNVYEPPSYNPPSYGLPPYQPENIPLGNHGHIYLPLPPPGRLMSQLRGYFNRRYGGRFGLYGNYPPNEPYAVEKPTTVEVVTPVQESAPIYKPPVEVVEVKPIVIEEVNLNGSSEEKEDEYESKSESKEEKDEYKEEKEREYEEDKKDCKTGKYECKGEKEDSPVSQISPQAVQPVVPVYVQPTYVYQPQYYSHPASLYTPTAPMTYAPPPPTYSYSPFYSQSAMPYSSMPAYSVPPATYPPAMSSYVTPPSVPTYPPGIPSYTAPAPVQAYSPAVPSYTAPFSAPAPTYSPALPSYAAPATAPAYSPAPPSYTPPTPPSYTPPAPAPTYSPAPPAYTPPATAPAYSPAPSSYTPPAPSQTQSYSPAQGYTPPNSPPSSSYSPSLPSYSIPSIPEPARLESLYPSYCNPFPNYYKRTYSTSYTYMLPPLPCQDIRTSSYTHDDADQPLKSCPELFTPYEDNLGSSYPLKSPSVNADDR